MRRLSPSQPVVLDLEEEGIECVVEVVSGDEATLAPTAPADAAYIPSLGRAAALVFGAGASRARIRGAVMPGSEEGRLRFVAGRGAGLPARRQTARAGAALTVEVTTPDAPERPLRLPSADISLGGVGVRREDWAPDVGTVVGVAIALPAAPAIRGTARVLRVTEEIAGLEFTDIAAVERGRLAAFLIATRGA
jgi:hypothetical protein